MKYKTITSYKVNTENPFVDDLFQIEISSRKKLLSSKTPSMIINGETGEVEGTQVLAIFEKVDREQFTKIYRKGLMAMYDLSKAGIRVFSYIASMAKPNRDTVIFDIDDCKEFTGYKTHPPINTGLSELVESGFIARTKKHYMYFINPTMFFNGNRYVFMKAYQLDEQSTTIPKSVTKKGD